MVDELDRQEIARRLLLRTMRDFSEYTWCAGWMGGLEHAIWKEAQRGEYFGGMPWMVLIEAAGGIWTWPDDADDVVFVSLEDWTGGEQ